MLLPPILELYVVWHPEDSELGEATAETLVKHFHGPAYAGLAGGAVEVYSRSEGWDSRDQAPRPLPFMEALPAQLPSAQLTAVVPILGLGLAEAVETDDSWYSFVDQMFASAPRDLDDDGASSDVVGVYAVLEPDLDLRGYRLEGLSNRGQRIPERAVSDSGVLAREVAQALAQNLHRSQSGPGLPEDPIKVFVSHTKQHSDAEQGCMPVVDAVRSVIRESHLSEFFDAHDIQLAADWIAEIERAASRSALLMVRTDLYASREWTQREVLISKQHDLPIVSLFAATGGDERGSFLMDHVPVYPCTIADPNRAIELALNRLVDETLKRALWSRQTIYLRDHGFDWMPGSAPELVTLLPWLAKHRRNQAHDPHLWILHPDPPLGPAEFQVIKELCALPGSDQAVDVLTPRTFASQGGSLHL